MTVVFIVIFSLLGNNSAKAQEKRITIEEAVHIAFENNPTVKAAQFEIEKQEALKKSAIDFSKTDVSYTNGQINGPQQDYEWTISQEIKFPSIYGTQSKLQKEKIVLSETNLLLRKNILERDVRSIYLNLVYQKSNLKLIETLEMEYNNFEIIADKRFETGESNLIEKISAEGKSQEIKLLKIDAFFNTKNFQNQLQLILNIDSIVYIKDISLQRVNLNSDTLNMKLVPILKMGEQAVKISEREHKLEKAAFLPDLSAGYFNQQVEGVKGFSGFQVGIKVPLFFWSQKGKVDAAKKNTDIARMNLQQSKIELTTAMKFYMTELEKYKAAVTYYENKGLELADKLFSSTTKAYKEGEIEYIEYISTLEQSVTIKRKYLENLNLYNQMINEINFLNGKYN
jgi:cobalt-zinc-cadmium resistance protein CzcA